MPDLVQSVRLDLKAMRRPVVGVIGNAYRIENRFATQMVGERNLRAVAEVAGALPLMFAGSPRDHRYRRLAGCGRRRRADRRPRQCSPDAFRHRAGSPARTLRHPSRRSGAGAVGSLRRPRRAAVRHLPRPAGDERRLRRLAASGNPRIAGPHEPPDAAAGERRNPSRSQGHLRRPPRRQPGSRRRLRANPRLRDHPRQLAARPGHPRTRQTGRRSRAWRRTAPSRRSGSRTRRALRSACNGTPNTIRSAIRSTARCFRRLARRWWRASGWDSWRIGPMSASARVPANAVQNINCGCGTFALRDGWGLRSIAVGSSARDRT